MEGVISPPPLPGQNSNNASGWVHKVCIFQGAKTNAKTGEQRSKLHSSCSTLHKRLKGHLIYIFFKIYIPVAEEGDKGCQDVAEHVEAV